MTDLGVSSGPSTATTGADAARREVRRRSTLPSGRAVVGGFLVAAAVVGVVAVATGGSGTPADAYAVVTVDVDAGEELGPGDLDLVPLDLPDEQRAVSYTDLSVLQGATALAPLAAGQLVQSSDVAKPPGGPGLASVSLPVEPARALDGDLRRGDRVDVIATSTEGGGPSTRTVTAGALVIDVIEQGSGGLGGPTELSVELAVPPEDLEAVAEAGAVATVTLARTTGVAADDRDPPPAP
jgi:Flp pilus assembly protein CpaB